MVLLFYTMFNTILRSTLTTPLDDNILYLITWKNKTKQNLWSGFLHVQNFRPWTSVSGRFSHTCHVDPETLSCPK